MIADLNRVIAVSLKRIVIAWVKWVTAAIDLERVRITNLILISVADLQSVGVIRVESAVRLKRGMVGWLILLLSVI